MPTRPDTVFFLSDYGTRDEFAGVVRAVLRRLAPDAIVIDLTHEVPPFDVAAGARTLVRSMPYLGDGVVLAVVDPGVGSARRGVALRVDGVEHLFNCEVVGARSAREAVPIAVNAERDEVARPDGHVGVEENFLGHVAQRPVGALQRLAVHRDLSALGRLQTEDHSKEGGLARSVGADQSGELPVVNPEIHVVEDLASVDGHVHLLDAQQF